PGQWAAFKGGSIPPGPNLIWPPRKLGDHFARHGFPAAQFQKWFLHLSDSGYWLTWIDLFSGAGGDYLNMVWQPARGRWRAHVGIDAGRFQETFNEAVEDRYFPVLADVGTWSGMPRYAAIYRENEPGRFELRFGLTDEQAQAGFKQLVAQGFVPQSSSVISINGQRRHTVLYRKAAAGSFWARSGMTADEYQQAWQLNQAAGRNVRFLDVYRHMGQAYFSAIFSELPKGEGIGKHGLDGSAFQQAFEEGYQEGFRLQLVAGYDGANERRYAASWFRQAAPLEKAARVVARGPAATADAPSAKLSIGHAQRAEQRIPQRMRHRTRAVGSSADEGGDIIHRRD
ncbi:MAG: hypothetical protein HKO64_02880, partial [Xanthomonadales bacterium]|nr:hypothetical protein [Xanthomonadales bacterium]